MIPMTGRSAANPEVWLTCLDSFDRYSSDS
jgi:hypothetical protein